MSDLAQMSNHPFVETLGWSLIHFLWQGMLIAILAAAVLALLKKASASLRYFVACLAFVLMAASPAATVWTLNSDRATASGTAANNTEVASAIAGPSGNGSVVTTGDLAATLPQTPDELPEHPAGGSATTATATESSAGTLEPWLTTLVAGWLFGVTALSLRLVLTLLQVSRLRSQVTSIVPQEMTDRLAELTRRLGVSRPVRLAQSALVEVPTVIGALKPLILLPATAMTGLSAEQLDAILAHEIAHIRRHDYLVNLVQTVIETLLFYHPGVWWLSGKIRQERENCCDDIASDLCENPIRYAEALVRMEELRTPAGGLALAATGGSLKSRIRRLLGQTSHESSTSWWVGGLVSLLIVFGLVVTLGGLSTQSQAEEPVRAQPTEDSTDAQTPPDKEETKDEVEPLTPASIADSMEKSMKQYATIDFSADHLKSDGSESERSKPTGESREVEATIRYRADGNRFRAERNAIDRSNGGTWIEGFDGKTHYHTDRGLLILGEESLMGQALSPLNLLFSHNGRPTETLRFLRDDNAKIVAETNIEGTTCQVIEIPFSREDRSWTYRINRCPPNDHHFRSSSLDPKKVKRQFATHSVSLYRLLAVGTQNRWPPRGIPKAKFHGIDKFRSRDSRHDLTSAQQPSRRLSYSARTFWTGGSATAGMKIPGGAISSPGCSKSMAGHDLTSLNCTPFATTASVHWKANPRRQSIRLNGSHQIRAAGIVQNVN